MNLVYVYALPENVVVHLFLWPIIRIITFDCYGTLVQ
jgi:hypothetical protein